MPTAQENIKSFDSIFSMMFRFKKRLLNSIHDYVRT